MKKIIAAVFMLSASGAALAQNAPNTPNLEQLNQNPEKQIKEEQKAAAAATAAMQVSSADVTFEQILAEPDDVDLNERFAMTQIRKGDLRGAATTLERVLLVDPTRYRTRLLYGVVLVRLDDISDAAQQLDAVLAVPDLPQDVRDETSGYRRAVSSRQRDSHFDARVTVGFGYDSNINAAPDDNTRLVDGVPFTLDPLARHKADGSFQAVGSVGGDHDFGGPRGDSVFARVTYFRSEQKVYDLLNLQAYSPSVGATFRTPWADVTPSFSFDHILLDQSTYLRSYNSDLRVLHRWSGGLESWFEFTDADQDFVNTPLVTNATALTGNQMDFSIGSAWSATPTDRFSLTLLHRRKLAQDAAYGAYRRESIGGEWLHLLGKGRFIVLSGTGFFDRYEVADAAVLPGVVRHDDTVIAQALYGQPLELLSPNLKNFTGSIGYEYYMAHSNVANYEYTNHKVTALLTYKWGI